MVVIDAPTIQMSASIVISEKQRWDVKNWVFCQLFDDIRMAYPANGKLQEYLDRLEPILFDDLRDHIEEVRVGQVYCDVAARIVRGELPTKCSDELRPFYVTALRDLVQMLKADDRFIRRETGG